MLPPATRIGFRVRSQWGGRATFVSLGRRAMSIRLEHLLRELLAGFLAVTAVAGGIGLITGLLSPTMDWPAGSAFQSYLMPGLVHLFVVGGSAAFAPWAEARGDRWAGPLAILSGFLLLCFEIVQISVVGLHLDPPLQLAYIVIGLALIGLGWRALSAARSALCTLNSGDCLKSSYLVPAKDTNSKPRTLPLV